MDRTSEAWLLQISEARYVCNLPTLERRQAYLDGVTSRRGAAAGDSLRLAVAEQWRTRDQWQKPHSPDGSTAAVDAQHATPIDPPPAHGSFLASSVAGNSDPGGPLGDGVGG